MTHEAGLLEETRKVPRVATEFATGSEAQDATPMVNRAVRYVRRNLLTVAPQHVDQALDRVIEDPEWEELIGAIQSTMASQPPPGDSAPSPQLETRMGTNVAFEMNRVLNALGRIRARELRVRPELPLAWLQFPQCVSDPRVPEEVSTVVRNYEAMLPAALASILGAMPASGATTMLLAEYTDRAVRFGREWLGFLSWYYDLPKSGIELGPNWDEFFAERRRRINAGAKMLADHVLETGNGVDLRKLIGGDG